MDGTTPGPLAPFDPGEAPREFRAALGSFATGVAVVTARTPEGPVGITVNSFSSVSLDPPLILWSPDRGSNRFPDFETAEAFAVHVLGHDQKPMGDAFTRAKDAFDGLDWTPGTHGVPLIAGAQAIFECRAEARHDGGDHLIVIGRVHKVHRGGGEPLIFHGGRYGTFAGKPG